jgi:uncharacterized protein
VGALEHFHGKHQDLVLRVFVPLWCICLLAHRAGIASLAAPGSKRESQDSGQGQGGMGGFDALRGKRYLNLETFRKNGQGVRTPIWFAADPGDDATLYVYTLSQSGKAKRLRNGGAVRVAACNVWGTVTGRWLDAQGSIVDDAKFRHGMQLIDRKYRPWKQVLDLLARLRPQPRVVIAIRQSVAESVGDGTAR